MKGLSGNVIPTSRTLDFLEQAYSLIDANWHGAQAREARSPSKENWRFDARPNIARKNTSPEVVLERAIVRDVPGDWANQIPTSSGLVGPSRDKTRNIDLALKNGPDDYIFFELKVASNTPVFAAVEIVLYGLLYIWSRTEANRIGYSPNRVDLLRAKSVSLRTLAPGNYYDGLDFRSLARNLDEGLRDFATAKLGQSLTMGFAFEQLHDYTPDINSDSVRNMVENRQAVYRN